MFNCECKNQWERLMATSQILNSLSHNRYSNALFQNFSFNNDESVLEVAGINTQDWKCKSRGHNG